MSTRKPGSNRHGGAFTEAERVAVWQKGRIVAGYDPANYRQDACEAWMSWDAYGVTSHSQGWEIDHLKPVSAGGGDELANLQPLQWQNNRHKGDSWPNWTCMVSAA